MNIIIGISVYLQVQNDKDGTNIQQYTAHMHIAAYRVSMDVRHVNLSKNVEFILSCNNSFLDLRTTFHVVNSKHNTHKKSKN